MEQHVIISRYSSAKSLHTVFSKAFHLSIHISGTPIVAFSFYLFKSIYTYPSHLGNYTNEIVSINIEEAKPMNSILKVLRKYNAFSQSSVLEGEGVCA